AWRELARQLPREVDARAGLAAALRRSGNRDEAWAEVAGVLAEVPADEAAWTLASEHADAAPVSSAALTLLGSTAQILDAATPSLAGAAARTAAHGPVRALAAAAAAVNDSPDDPAALERYAATLACATL